jgi:hypothetical protein
MVTNTDEHYVFAKFAQYFSRCCNTFPAKFQQSPDFGNRNPELIFNNPGKISSRLLNPSMRS